MKFAFCILLTLIARAVDAQTLIETSQTAYFEFVGNSRALVSVNYERILIKSKRSCCILTGRVGMGFDERFKDSSGIIDIPLEVSILVGKRTNFLEGGFGWTATFGRDFVDKSVTPAIHYPPYFYAWVFRVGYRYMVFNRIVLRVAPLLLLPNAPNLRPQGSFGFEIGYAF